LREHEAEAGTIDLRELWSRLGDATTPRAVAAAAAFLLSFYVGLALAYRDSIPLFEAPDEPSHLHYAAFVHSERRLPRQPLEVPGAGMQPPLAYVVAAPLLGATDLDVAAALDDLRAVGLSAYELGGSSAGGPALAISVRGKRYFATDGSLTALHVLRGTSLAFGALAVIFTFAAAWRVSRDARLSLLAASLLAFNPQFLFTSSTFSNGAAAAAVGAAALWIVVRALGDSAAGPSRGHYLAGALLFALGMLTQLATLPGLVAAAATIAAVDRREPRARRADLALALGAVLLLTGPVLLWSAQHRGGFLGLDAAITPALGLVRQAHFAGVLQDLPGSPWESTFEAYWCRFGWFNVAAPELVYLVCFGLTWTGVLGFAAGHRREGARWLHSRALRGYLTAAVAATVFAHLAVDLALESSQAQQLFASAPQLSLLLALGIYRLIGSERRMLPLTMSVAALLIALDVYCLRAVLVPAYLEVP
jgi:hypothetical protein